MQRSEEYKETRSEEFGEIRSSNIDFRIKGLPHSTAQQEDDVRRETVKKPIHQFETHPNRESLMAQEPTIQSVQREVEGIDPQHGKHGVLRDVRDHF